MPWSGGRIFDDSDLKSLLKKFTQMALDAEVGEHPRQNHFAQPAFAQLKHEIVRLRTPHFVRANHDGIAVLDEWLVPREPVRPGAGEAIPSEWIGTKELPRVEHH